jgi:predicted HTH domain antitoxin
MSSLFNLQPELTQVSEAHRRKAERKATEAYVLSLLQQGDIDLEEACEMLTINMEDMVKLISKSEFRKHFQLNYLGLTASDRTYISRQATQFEQMKTQLNNDEYLEKWVWFEDGKILDSDENHQALLKRVSAKVGERVVFIQKIDHGTNN